VKVGVREKRGSKERGKKEGGGWLKVELEWRGVVKEKKRC
jgi:hypothetical protein